MKTPDDIKKGLQHCFMEEYSNCRGCPYYDSEDHELKCLDEIQKDAFAYIQQLEETVAKQNEKYKRLLETASILSDAIYEKEE